jgi:hypothetical protein
LIHEWLPWGEGSAGFLREESLVFEDVQVSIRSYAGGDSASRGLRVKFTSAGLIRSIPVPIFSTFGVEEYRIWIFLPNTRCSSS